MSYKKWLALVAGSLLLTGCGSSAGMSSSSSSMGNSSSSSTVSSSTAKATKDTLTVKNGKFTPAKIHIKAGQAVTFVFDGVGTDHFMLSNGKTSPKIKVGSSWSYTFKKSGTFTVKLKKMPMIKATIVVH